MLKSELHRIEGLIADLNSNASAAVFNSRAERERWVNLFGRECESIRQKWLHHFFGNAKEEVVLRYVQFHQHRLENLSDRLFRQAKDGQEKDHLYYIHDPLLEEIEKLLFFLQDSFNRYFDKNAYITYFHAGKITVSPEVRNQQLSTVPSSTDSDSLLYILTQWLYGLRSDIRTGRISYRNINDINYVESLIKLFGPDHDIAGLELALLRADFNLPIFINWYKLRISQQLNTAGDAQAKAKLITHELSILEGTLNGDIHPFEPQLPSLYSDLIPWLRAGIGNELKQNALPAEIKPGITSMPLNYSVAQFALFVRLFYAGGAFRVSNVAMIHRFFSRYYTTKKQENISVKSFARAFYNADQSTAAVVRDHLQQMLQFLNKTYFPK